MSHSLSRFSCIRPLLGALPVSLLTALPAMAQDTAEAPVVRSPQRITVNGDDTDWKGIPEQAVQGNQGEVARFRAAFDVENFYVLVRVKDDSPLKNSASANDPAMMLKTGDALGLTFGSAGGQGQEQRFLLALVGGKPEVVVLRPQSATKKPYTYASPVSKVTHEYVDRVPEARVALKTVPGGYLAEIALPWKTLGFQAREGLTFPFDLQVILSDPAGQINASTAWWHSVGGGALATVDLPSEARLYPELWGKARLYLTAPLTADRPMGTTKPVGVPITYTVAKPGKVSLNITDEKGWILRELITAQPHQPGTYILYWNGRDEYGDPMPPGKYRWKALVFDGVSSKRLGGAGNSARPPFRTPDGKGDLGAVHGTPAAVAADEEGVYHLSGTEEGNKSLTKLTPDGFTIWKRSAGSYGNGQAVTANAKLAAMIVNVGGKTVLVTMDPSTGRDLAVGAKGARFELGDDKLRLKGLALVGERAYYCLPNQNQVAVLNLATGRPEAPLSAPSPRDVVRQDDATLLIVSGDKVLRWNLASGQSQPVLSGLEEPQAVAQDKNGGLLVALWGSRQQIARYSAQGKLLSSIGKAGGRPATAVPYDPNALYRVRSLALAPDGNIWFLEESELRRAGVFAPDGKWVRDVYQTLPSQAGAGVDLDEPNRVFFHTGYASMVGQARIDFAANAADPANPSAYWKMEAVYNMTGTGEYTPPAPDDVAALSTRGSFYNPIAFTAANGKRYLWHEGDTASLWIKQGTRLIPLHVIGVNNREGGTLFPKGKRFTWSDTDGDGKPSEAEITFFSPLLAGWRFIGRDLTLYGNGGSLKPYKVDARGVPFYRPEDWKADITSGPGLMHFFRDGGYGSFPSPPAPDGARYTVFNVGAGQQASFWDRATYSRIARIKDGKIQWIAGQHDGSKRNPGGAVYLWRPLGEVDDVMVVGDVDFHLLAYTKDGFNLGGVTPHYSQAITPENIVQENVQAGHFVKDPRTGKPLIVIGSGTEAMVLEVTGLEPNRFTRLGGEFTLESAQPASPQTPGHYNLIYRTWPQRDNGRYMWVTGDGWGWRREVPWLQIKDDARPVGDVRLRRDAGTLQVFATVLDSTPLAKEGAPQLGQFDGLELLLGPAIQSATGETAAGTTRLFITATRQNGTLAAKVLGNRPTAGAVLTASPAQGAATGDTEAVQPLYPVPGVKVAARPTFNGYGYRLEAEIPLSYFPQITREREVQYIRNHQPGAKRPGDLVEKYSGVRPDITGPVRLNVAFWDGETGRRFPWVADGQDAKAGLNPAKWGQANALVTLQWPYVPGAKVNLYRGTTPRLEQASLATSVTDTDFAGDAPGMGTHWYWAEAVGTDGKIQLAGPQEVALGTEKDVEPRLNFNEWRPNPAAPLTALPALQLFAGTAAVVDVAASGEQLTAQAPAGVTVVTLKLDKARWRVSVQAGPDLPAAFQGQITLTSSGGGPVQKGQINVTGTASRLAGVLRRTGGELALNTAQLAQGKPVAELDWAGEGTLERRSIGASGYVLFRRRGYGDAVPTAALRPPFENTFTGPDGFWYGDGNSNMRFDLDGVPGKDSGGVVRFGSVNSNAGTPEAGPAASWKINVTDDRPHWLTVFTPASGPNAAKHRFTLTASDGSVQKVEFDGSQGGAVLQFAFRGNVALRVQQTVGGQGSSIPGANCAALFLD